MKPVLLKADSVDLPALYHIPVEAGEYMHKALGLSHWYPFMPLDQFILSCSGKRNYMLLVDDVPVGMFNLTSRARHYYDIMMWHDPMAKALYFGNFAILPEYQGKGLGSWCMKQVDEIAQSAAYEAVRFDALARHKLLLDFYAKNGYEQRGLIKRDWGSLMCFEKTFPQHNDRL